jgi:hypothetical protein
LGILFHEVGVGWTGESGHGQGEREWGNCEEFIIKELRNSSPVTWVSLEHFGNEAFAIFRNICIFRIRIVAVLDFGVGGLDITGLERGSADS